MSRYEKEAFFSKTTPKSFSKSKSNSFFGPLKSVSNYKVISSEFSSSKIKDLLNPASASKKFNLNAEYYIMAPEKSLFIPSFSNPYAINVSNEQRIFNEYDLYRLPNLNTKETQTCYISKDKYNRRYKIRVKHNREDDKDDKDFGRTLSSNNNALTNLRSSYNNNEVETSSARHRVSKPLSKDDKMQDDIIDSYFPIRNSVSETNYKSMYNTYNKSNNTITVKNRDVYLEKKENIRCSKYPMICLNKTRFNYDSVDLGKKYNKSKCQEDFLFHLSHQQEKKKPFLNFKLNGKIYKNGDAVNNMAHDMKFEVKLPPKKLPYDYMPINKAKKFNARALILNKNLGKIRSKIVTRSTSSSIDLNNSIINKMFKKNAQNLKQSLAKREDPRHSKPAKENAGINIVDKNKEKQEKKELLTKAIIKFFNNKYPPEYANVLVDRLLSIRRKEKFSELKKKFMSYDSKEKNNNLYNIINGFNNSFNINFTNELGSQTNRTLVRRSKKPTAFTIKEDSNLLLGVNKNKSEILSKISKHKDKQLYNTVIKGFSKSEFEFFFRDSEFYHDIKMNQDFSF